MGYHNIKHINFMGYAHFNHGNGYNNYADYDTNSPSIEHWLAKTNAYLHYLDHIFAEILEVIDDILIRLEEIESDLDELKRYMHVPSKYDKTDDTHDYITVKNENRTVADGLSDKLVDIWQQHHLMDTSKLDSIIDRLIREIGLETELIGQQDPGDGTCLTLGDITEYDELKITYASHAFSIPRLTSFLIKRIGANNSCTFSNIADDNIKPNNLKVNGEIGQVLLELSGTMANVKLCFDNSQLWRFENVSGSNNAWNRDTGAGPNGSFAFSTSTFPNPSYGNGWIRVLKITGVSYGLPEDAYQQQQRMLLKRLRAHNYVTYNDYNTLLVQAIASGSEIQIELLEHLERFEKEYKRKQVFNEPDLSQYNVSPLTRYDELKAYRDVLRGAIVNV